MAANTSTLYVLVRAWNGFSFLERCIASILSQQTSQQFKIILVDDDSDYTHQQQKQLFRTLSGHLVIKNQFRQFSVKNAFSVIHQHVPHNAVVVNVDGDDWLPHQHVLEHISQLYQDKNCWLSYGGCEYYLGEKKETAALPISPWKTPPRYSVRVEQDQLYRSSFFLPIHLRSWRADLFKKIKERDLKRPDGSWLRFCEDQAFFLPMLEMAAGKYQVTSELLYTYNLSTSLSDHLLNRKQKLLDELCVRSKKPYRPLLHL